jgi:hypothetical protein
MHELADALGGNNIQEQPVKTHMQEVDSAAIGDIVT